MITPEWSCAPLRWDIVLLDQVGQVLQGPIGQGMGRYQLDYQPGPIDAALFHREVLAQLAGYGVFLPQRQRLALDLQQVFGLFSHRTILRLPCAGCNCPFVRIADYGAKRPGPSRPGLGWKCRPTPIKGRQIADIAKVGPILTGGRGFGPR